MTRMERSVDELSKNFNRERKKHKKNQSELKNTITKMKNTPEGITSRWEDSEEQIHDLEDRVMGSTQTEEQKKVFKNEDKLRDLWDNIKSTNINIIRVSGGGEKRAENLLEGIMIENFSKLGRETGL